MRRGKWSRKVEDRYDLELIKELASKGCTGYEIAALCGYSEGYFYEMKKADPRIQESIDRGIADLHLSLRKRQIDVAMEGNPQMLIHLGKVELGQNDKIELNQNIKAEVEYEVKFGEAIEKGDQASETSSSTGDSSE